MGDKSVVATIDTSADIRSFSRAVDAVYEVKWVDSFGFFGWVDLSDAEGFEPSVCHTAGYIISNDGNRVVVAQGQSTSGCVYGAIAIPVVCIQKITQLS
jgi:hypothetical protein